MLSGMRLAQRHVAAASLSAAAEAASVSGRTLAPSALHAGSAAHISTLAPLRAALLPQHPQLHQQLRFSQCNCPTLKATPAKKVVFEFDPTEVDRFIALADEIEEEFPELVVEGNVDQDGRPGSFEVVTEDGLELFSRMETSRFPIAMELISKLRAANPA